MEQKPLVDDDDDLEEIIMDDEHDSLFDSISDDEWEEMKEVEQEYNARKERIGKMGE